MRSGVLFELHTTTAKPLLHLRGKWVVKVTE